MRSDKRGALLVVIVLGVSAVLGGLYGPTARATAAGATDLQDTVKSFSQVLAVVQNNYAIPVDTNKLVYDGAIPGMLRMLDPHSYFFDPKQWAITREDEAGKYYGRFSFSGISRVQGRYPAGRHHPESGRQVHGGNGQPRRC